MTEQAPIYVYDGVCVLCSGAVQYVLRHDRSDPPIRFVDILSPEGRALSAAHGIDPENPKSFIYIEAGKAYTQSDAVFALFDRSGGAARYLKLFRFVPRPVRDWAYRLIARNRYRIFGRRDQCYIPAPEERDRFSLSEDVSSAR